MLRVWQHLLRVWQHSFTDINYEIFSLVILSLILIQILGQLSVSGERMCIVLVSHLEDCISLSGKSMVR